MFKAKQRRKKLRSISLLIISMRKKRLQILIALLNVLQIYLQRREVHRSCRRFGRNNGWWEIVWNNYSDERFKKTFRVSKDTFTFILTHIRHELERHEVNEEPISPECRLGICLYRLDRGDYYYTISEMSGLGVSTIQGIVSQVSQGIVENLWNDSAANLTPVSEEDYKQLMENMINMCNFHSVGVHWMGVTSQSSARQVGLKQLKSTTILKTFIQLLLLPW